MGQSKETFLLYKNHIESILELDNFQAGIVFKNILRYVNGLELEFDSINSLEYGIFKGIKTQIDFSIKKYNEKCEKNKINAKKRWNNANAYERMHNDNDIDSENENDIYNDNDVVDNLRQDIDLSTTTTTPTNNLNEYLNLGEFKNVVITRGQYNKQLAYTKSDAKKYQVDIKDVEIPLFVEMYINELSENIACGKVEKFNLYEPNKHAEILHKYRRQKLQKCNDICYIQKYGHPLKEIRNQEQEIIF